MTSNPEPEDEKKDWPTCVFYRDVKCPVRFEMAASTSVKKIIEPLKPKFDDRTTGMEIGKSMMEGVMKAMGMEWSFLAAFCHICPLKFREDQKLMKYPPAPTVSVKILECPKCGQKGIFNYCPECGTKVAEEKPQ